MPVNRPDVGAAASADVLIAGGGLIGASLAIALSGLPLRVALVERVPFAADAQPSFDSRSVALSRSSRRILGALGVWEPVAEQATPIRRVHVSERGRFGTAVIDADEEGVEALGYVVEARALGAVLWRTVESRPGLRVLCPAGAASPLVHDDDVSVRIEGDGGTLRTRLLVVADGAGSPLRASLGIAATARPYGQTAIVGNVAAERPVPAQAFERFTPEGPLALLPVGDGRYTFVLARATGQAGALMALEETDFLHLLQEAFGQRLGRFTRLGRRACYPLELVRAGDVVSRRAVLVGNAAHGLHPVAAQGYNLGLRDVAILAELIADALHADPSADPGDPALLRAYAEWRGGDQRKVVAFTDGLVRLFGIGGRGPALARGLALQAFDVLPGAKSTLARHTMGLSGRLGRLARGLPL